METSILALRKQIAGTERRLEELKEQLSKAEQDVREAARTSKAHSQTSDRPNGDSGLHQKALEDPTVPSRSSELLQQQIQRPLHSDEYKRYGRQLIMPEIGLPGQLRLKNSKVLVVGVGGLGCPAAAYLAGAGIGTLGLMDGDTVESSNLHRQTAHATNRIGMSKVDSACEYLQGLNPLVTYNCHPFHLSPEKAISVFEEYDVVLDCTDHPTSRYLISDACVLTGRPLVSASALRTDGQLIVLNHPPRPSGDLQGGPCYRCIFPKPPPAESVLSCGEGGILGPVVGVMGVLQALEAIKLLCANAETPETHASMSNGTTDAPPTPSMLMFSAYSRPQFRTVRLRSRRKNCAVCSSTPTITKDSLVSGSLDYITFCGVTAPIDVLRSDLRISARDFAGVSRADRGPLIDVRDETQFAICALPDSVNIPWTGNDDTWLDRAKQSGVLDAEKGPQYVICRFGNDSQLAARAMMDCTSRPVEVKDIKGGFQSWREEVDPQWPDY